MKLRFLVLLGLNALFLSQCCPSDRVPFRFYFDNRCEVSGKKMALSEINPNLPRNWDNYNYVQIEYKISTSQRFQLGFTSDLGYNELRVMSYVPNAWNKLSIPLSYFTQSPEPSHDLASTMNHARYTGWINLDGKRGCLHGVDTIGIRIRKPIGNPYIEIRNVELFIEDPGDEYLASKPAVDIFGQSNLVDYPDKIKSFRQLSKKWAQEDKYLEQKSDYNYSKFGGYKNQRIEGTGFFRTQKIDGKWWFVDPEGYLFLSVGIDCVSLGVNDIIRDYDIRKNMFPDLPPKDIVDIIVKHPIEGITEDPNDFSFIKWNLYRRYGDDYIPKAVESEFKRMDKWGLNTIACWSDPLIFNHNKKAFTLNLDNLAFEKELMGVPDIYQPHFKEKMTEAIKEKLGPYVNNPWVLGYFIGNEPAWVSPKSCVTQIILDGKERPIKEALIEYLKVHGDSPEARFDFLLTTFDQYLSIVDEIVSQVDPNHINLGVRFGEPDTINDEIIKVACKHFDVFCFNSYSLTPHKHMLDRTLEMIDIPMIIGEYHAGTVTRGMGQALWQVDSEKDRGEAYRYYTEQAFSHMGIIGVAYFQWRDQNIMGRFDGENYNCGFIDVTDCPYHSQVEALSMTCKRLYDVHAGNIPPFDQYPSSARGYESIPDIWNK